MAASSTSSSGEQQYSLRWNDFHSSILSSFRHLRDQEDFIDVTLACDSDSFGAHKVVLSACSPYFRKLLKANPCSHPIVILRDVASSDMESLLRFMYHGEVHVGQEQLSAFLKTAQMLQVRGLADVNSSAAAKTPSASATSGNNASAPATPRNPWQDNGRGELNDSGLSPPPAKRPRSYSPPLGNHVETKSDLQDSLLGQALEGGPTIHTLSSTNNVQAQSTGEDSNSISDNEEDTSNNDSILNSVKTEPNEILNDSMEHHRNAFPAALLGLQGLMPGPSGIHAANQDPNFGRWQPSEGSWLAGNGQQQQQQQQPIQQQLQSQQPQQTQQTQQQQQSCSSSCSTSQQQSLGALGSLSPEQLSIMHQKLQNTLQQKQSSEQQLNLMLQSCAKKKIEELALLHPFQHQLDVSNAQQHQQQPKPKCPECGKIYSNNSNLKQHIVNVHTVQTEYISCHVCSKQFKTKQYLQIHLLSMHGIRKRKSYPVYQMQPQQFAPGSVNSQQHQPFPPTASSDRWSLEDKTQQQH